MNEYYVYFEIYGKKMKTRIYAANEDLAKGEVKNKIIFHKVVEVEDHSDGDVFEDLMNLFGKKRP